MADKGESLPHGCTWHTHSRHYTARDCRSRHQLGEISAASFTFMEHHQFPPAADSAPLCPSAPQSELFFPGNFVFWGLLLLWGLGGKQRCVFRKRTLEVSGEMPPCTATFCHLLLPLTPTWLWHFSCPLLRRGSQPPDS